MPKPRNPSDLAALISACVFAAAFQSSLFASSDLGGLSLMELLQVKITGATLVPEEQLSVPASVSVYTGDEIRALGIESMEELMDFVPGFQSFQMGESGHSLPFSSRGRKVGTTSREVLVLIDGHRIDTTYYGGAPFSMPMLSLGNVERIEFMRGPGSAIYGSGAFLGAINILTERDARRYGASAGSNGRIDAYLAFSGETGGLAYDVFLRGFSDGGEGLRIFDPFSGEIDSSDPQHGEDARLRLSWGEWRFSYLRSHREADDFYVIGTAADGFNEYDTAFDLVSLEREIRWGPDHSTSLFLSYRHWEETGQFRALPEGALSGLSDPPSEDAVYLKPLAVESELAFNARHEWRRDADTSVVAGIEYRAPNLSEVKFFNNFDLADISNNRFPVRYYGDFDQATSIAKLGQRDVFGAFAQIKRSLAGPLSLTAGIRFDDDSAAGSRLSPRIALIYATPEDFVLKLLYSEAFRSPSTAEMTVLNNPFVTGNPNLNPEVVKTAELIAHKQWQSQSVTLSLFSNDFEGSIVNGFIDGLRTFVNSASEYSSGFELEYRGQLASNLQARASLTRIFSRPDSTLREAGSLASASLTYNRGDWNVGLGVSYAGSRSMFVPIGSGVLELDDYLTTTAQIRRRLNARTSVYVKALNLFDTDYRTPPQAESLPDGIPNRGRQIRAGFDAAF